MRRLLPILLLGLLLGGCAAPGTKEAPRPRRVQFAVIPAPALGGRDAAAEAKAEDRLLDVVTRLTARPDLDFVLVPGPLVVGRSSEARDALTGALGSLAAPVLPALGPKDDPGLAAALRQALAPSHPVKEGAIGPAVDGVVPVAAGADGALPLGGAGRGSARVAVTARGVALRGSRGRVLMVVSVGPKVRLTTAAGRVRLDLPPLAAAPHLYGVVTLAGGVVRLTLLRADGAPAPPAPPPVRLELP